MTDEYMTPSFADYMSFQILKDMSKSTIDSRSNLKSQSDIIKLNNEISSLKLQIKNTKNYGQKFMLNKQLTELLCKRAELKNNKNESDELNNNEFTNEED